MTTFPHEDELVRVLAAAVMQVVTRYESVCIPRDSVSGRPENERFAVQIDGHNPMFYKVRVIELTGKQRREMAGRTEDALRAKVPEGWTVKIWHERETERGLMSKHRAKKLGYTLLARGGFTEVELVSPDGAVYYGSTTCSPKDNFCRAEGRAVALDRAVKKMEKEEVAFPPVDLLRENGYPDGFSARLPLGQDPD